LVKIAAFSGDVMLSLAEFDAALDRYLASDATPGQPQLALLQRWSEQLGQPETSLPSETELAEIRRQMWARIQVLTAAPDKPAAPNE
jgi:hypothetical protein